MDNLRRELERFDPELPISRAATPPSAWYTDPEILKLERSTIFGQTFQPVARLEELDGAGAYVSGELLEEPFVVVRGEDGELRAFFNVCRHHATCVASGSGHTKELVCPYHGWTYRLDGRLKKAPRMAGVARITRDDFGLVPLECSGFDPFAFVRVRKGEQPAPDVSLAAVRDALRLDGLVFVERRSYEVACNWKVFVDNYLDGGYHVAHLHPGLADQLDLGTYETTVHDWSVVQAVRGGVVGGAARRGDARARLGDAAAYVWLYPGLMLNRYGPWLDTNWVFPTGPERCRVVFDYFVERDRANDRAFIAGSLAASDQVQREDVAVCEAVQRGLRSSGYDTGVYAPKLEHGAHHFHRLLARQLREALRGDGV